MLGGSRYRHSINLGPKCSLFIIVLGRIEREYIDQNVTRRFGTPHPPTATWTYERLNPGARLAIVRFLEMSPRSEYPFPCGVGCSCGYCGVANGYCKAPRSSRSKGSPSPLHTRHLLLQFTQYRPPRAQTAHKNSTTLTHSYLVIDRNAVLVIRCLRTLGNGCLIKLVFR